MGRHRDLRHPRFQAGKRCSGPVQRSVATALAVIGLAACQHAPADHPPGADAPPYEPCSYVIPPSGPLCIQTCGNQHIDDCYSATNNGAGCPVYFPTREQCDGSDLPTCAGAGYYGGSGACSSGCIYDDTGCDACAPTDVACATDPGAWLSGAPVASGSDVAVASSYAFAIFDGSLAPTVTVHPGIETDDLIAVPGGWLGVSYQPPRLTPLAPDGATGMTVTIDVEPPLAATAGPGPRVLLAWNHFDNPDQWTTTVELVDATGAVRVAPVSLFAGNGGRVGVATDGTSYFVGSRGSLAKVAPDGTFTTTAGFPDDPTMYDQNVTVTWAGTTGWYIAPTSTAQMAQRFDSTGAPVGAPIAVPSTAWIADGNELIALELTGGKPSHVQLARVTSAGTAGTPVDVGVASYATFSRMGSDFVVGWTGTNNLRLARVAPPP